MVDSAKTSDTVNKLSEGIVSALLSNSSSRGVSPVPASTQAREETLADKSSVNLLEQSVTKPTALLLRAKITATTLTVPGARDYSFLLTLPEQVKLDLTNLGMGEVVVTGPNGYCQTAVFVAAREYSICYRVNAPNGIWTKADNGIYRINVMSDGRASPGMMQAFLVEIADDIGGCLIQNGSFENSLTHWVTFAGSERVSKTDAYIGTAALVLSTLDSGTSQNVVAKPGAIYQLTGYGRSTSQDYRSFGMTFFDAKGSLLLRSDVGTICSFSWQDYFAVAIAPTNTAYVQVWTYQGTDWGITYIDGLRLQQISEDGLPPTQVSQFSLINAPLAATGTKFG